MATETNFGRASDKAFVGEDIDLVFTVTSTDVTGWTVECAVGSVSASVALTDAANGVITASLVSANTTSLGAGVHSYKLRRTDAGDNTVLAYGTLTLTA